MSKSRGNVVSPDAIIESHGADSLRLYLMFLGPLEAMKPWSPRGIEGVHRFLQKVWRDCVGEDGGANPKIAGRRRRTRPSCQRLLHETIRKVGDDIEGDALQHRHLADDDLRERAAQGGPGQPGDGARLHPVAGALRAALRRGALVAPGRARASPRPRPWPKYDPAKMAAAEVRLVFQVNGKHRGDQLVPVGLAQDAGGRARDGRRRRSSPFLAGKTIAKVVYVPGRILNLVVP